VESGRFDRVPDEYRESILRANSRKSDRKSPFSDRDEKIFFGCRHRCSDAVAERMPLGGAHATRA